MAKCDTGYFCRICESYVEDITDSELYLRYVLGEVPFEQLVNAPEAHIRCVPELAQYIVDRAFGEPAVVDDPQHDKRHQDRAWVTRREQRVSDAWRRLQMLLGSGLGIEDYPLPPESSALIEPAS